MTWTTPTTWSAAQVVTATQLNEQLRDNLNYLISRPHGRVLHTAASNYTTSSPSFADIDPTNLSLSLTLSGSAVLVGFSGLVETGSGVMACFDLSVDGVRFTAAPHGLVAPYILAGVPRWPVSYTVLVVGLTVGSHVFGPMWCAVGGSITLFAVSNPVSFWALEVA
ncbi:MAG: hypothetical protein SNJ58_12870 [Aggregatilineales bacterium]